MSFLFVYSMPTYLWDIYKNILGTPLPFGIWGGGILTFWAPCYYYLIIIYFNIFWILIFIFQWPTRHRRPTLQEVVPGRKLQPWRIMTTFYTWVEWFKIKNDNDTWYLFSTWSTRPCTPRQPVSKWVFDTEQIDRDFLENTTPKNWFYFAFGKIVRN